MFVNPFAHEHSLHVCFRGKVCAQSTRTKVRLKLMAFGQQIEQPPTVPYEFLHFCCSWPDAPTGGCGGRPPEVGADLAGVWIASNPLAGEHMPHRWLRALRLGTPRRRQRQRIARYFDCTWLSTWGEEKARVSSLSPTGCYIESRRSVPPEGALIGELTITLPTGRLDLQGTVIDAMPGVGFAVQFSELDTNTREHLSALVRGAQP